MKNNNPVDNNFSTSDWNRFLGSISRPCLIGKDSNCHDLDFGSGITDYNDAKLKSSKHNSNFVILNDGPPTRVKNVQKKN